MQTEHAAPGTHDAQVLDNPAWHALCGAQSTFAQVAGVARRFRPDVSPFAAVASLDDGAWDDLRRVVDPADDFALIGEGQLEVPPGWTVLARMVGYQMVASGVLADVVAPAGFRPLGDDDVPAMLELIDLTRPGPFEGRTIELGGYHGLFEDGELIAMAGERLRPPGFAEVSAVATRPSAQRRGLGAAATALVARNIMDRGETPFLHVVEANVSAIRVYERLGFDVRRRATFTVLQASA